jgi:hypothetical protein
LNDFSRRLATNNTQVTIDLTYAKNPLFVRQTIAVALDIPIDRELTWDILRNWICDPDNRAMPRHLLFIGLPKLAVTLPHEERMLGGVLRKLQTLRPDVQILVVNHD